MKQYWCRTCGLDAAGVEKLEFDKREDAVAHHFETEHNVIVRLTNSYQILHEHLTAEEREKRSAAQPQKKR